MIVDTEFEMKFTRADQGFGTTTANILYRMPDNLELLQSFLWQFNDVAPEHPRLTKFIEFWMREIEGPIHSVEVAHTRLIKGSDLKYAQFEGRLH